MKEIYLKEELRKVKCEQIRVVEKHRIIGKKVTDLTENRNGKNKPNNNKRVINIF